MQKSRGFTLIELLVTIGILGILVGFSSWAYLNVQKNSDLSNQISQLLSTVRQVQALAISGQTQDQQNLLDMGIHWESNRYIIFYGSNYNPNDERNIATSLPPQITITFNLPTANLIFTKRTGEVQNYDSDRDSLIISHNDGQSHRIEINRWGVGEID